MPTMPAKIEARSESLPSVGETVSTRRTSTCVGKAPRLSTRDNERASPSVNDPEIDTDPLNCGSFTCGFDCTTSSSTIASWRDGHVSTPLKHCDARAFHVDSPPGLRPTVTVQPWSWVSCTSELSRLKIRSPAPPAGPTRHWPPSRVRSTVVSGAAAGTVVPVVGTDDPGTVEPGVAGTVEPGAPVAAASGTVVAGAADVVVGGAAGTPRGRAKRSALGATP